MEAHVWIRQGGTSIQGPFPVSRVRGWIKDGRVRQEMEFSTDAGATWLPGEACPDLFGAVDPVLSVTRPAAPPRPPPIREQVPQARRPPRTPRRHARSPGATSQAKGGKWVWIGAGVLLLAVIGAVTKKDEDPSGSRSDVSTAGLRRASFRGQPLGVFEHDFTFWDTPDGGLRNALLPIVAADPGIVGSSTLATLVDRVQRYREVRERQVTYVCFQWNAALSADEFGAERGHSPAFWIILSVDTINRIQNPKAVARHDWLKHSVESGVGQWTAVSAGSPASGQTSSSAPTPEPSSASGEARRRETTGDFVARFEALKKRGGDMLGVRLPVFLRVFGPPDEKMQFGGVLMRAYYDCQDGRIDVTITEGPDQWVPWVTAEPADGRAVAPEAGSGVEQHAREDEATRRQREAHREQEEREAEARRNREAAEEGRLREEEAAQREAETAIFKAAVPGVYRAAHVPGPYIGLGDETDLRYELALDAEGNAGAALFVRGLVRWRASGTWELLDENRPSGRGLRVLLQARDASVNLATRVEAGAQWSEAQEAPLFGHEAGRDRPAGVYRLYGPFFRRDLQPVELVRTGGAPPSDAAADPEALAEERRKQVAGQYVPTEATAQALRAKYGGRVAYRLRLDRDGDFRLYYDIPRARAVTMTGTWDWDGTTLTLRATRGNGRTLPTPKVDTFAFDGTTINMDGIILEKQ